MLHELRKDLHLTDKHETSKLEYLIKKPLFGLKFYTELVLRTGAPRSKKIIKVGDGVLIANADENIPYVATVEAFYTDSDESANDKFAIVKWFYRPCEVPSNKLPDVISDNEVFLCTSKTDQKIDAETIVDTCTITYDMATVSGSCHTSTYVCRKSFNGKKFETLPRCDLSQRHKKSVSSSPKVIVSKKSIRSTLTPTKSLNVKSRLNNVISSPISASSIDRVDASTVANDVLGSEDDSDFSDSAEDVDKVSTAPKTSRMLIKAGDKSVKPLSTKNVNKTSFTQAGKSLKKLSVSVQRLNTDTEKENIFSLQRSRRQQKKSGIASSPIVKLGADTTFSSDEGDSVDVDSLCSQKSPSKKRKLTIRRSARKPFKTKGSPKKVVVNDSESDIGDDFDDEVDDKSYEILGSSSSDESDFVKRKSTSKKKLSRRKKSAATTNRLRKGLKKTTPSLKTAKMRRAVIPERKTPIKLAASDFDIARERLHVSAVPDSLPCREEEFQAIYSFVEGKIKSGTGGCMYISGVPGTGKTATVMEVLSCLRDAVSDGALQDFNYVDINGMRLTEPHQAYVDILKQLKDMKATPDHAAELLTKHFNLRGKKATVMVVDELDLLCTRKQDVLYHIFDWPSHRHARLIVVAIANTMDLPERVMINKVASRLGLTRLSFLPYNYKQLQEIVTSRLRGLPVFDSDAVQLVSRKVAAVSGDARRCLDVCRRAIEIAEKNRIAKKCEVKPANIDEVHGALQEMFASPMIMLMRNCSVHEKLFLRSIVAEFKRSGVEEATLGQIFLHHAGLSRIEGIPPCNDSCLIKVCYQLVASRLVLLEAGNRDIYSRIRLNVSVDDVLFALNYD